MRKSWTHEDDQKIAEMICLFGNKVQGFKGAAESLRVSVKSVSSRYYRNQSIIDDYIIDWRYNQAYKTEGKPKKKETLWSRIKNWLHSL